MLDATEIWATSGSQRALVEAKQVELRRHEQPAPRVWMRRMHGAWQDAKVRCAPYHVRLHPVAESPRPEASAESTIEALMADWQRSTWAMSSVTDMVLHPSYQRIIGYGTAAVGPLLRALRTKPDHWFWALWAITGTDPVSEEDAGDMDAAARAWIDWGRARGLL